MVKHLCEICQSHYSTVPEAQRCEAQGILGPRYRPGLTLIRTDTEVSDLLKNTFIILKQEPNRGHDRVYRAGSTTFGKVDEPPGSSFLDHWEWGLYTGRDIKERLKNGKLELLSTEQFLSIERTLQVGMMELERAKKHPSVYSPPTGIVADILQALERYPIMLHYGLKQRI